MQWIKMDMIGMLVVIIKYVCILYFNKVGVHQS